MRRLAPLLVCVFALSGCLQSQTTVEGPDDCFIFCSERHDTTVHYDWVPPVLLILFVVLVVGIIIAVAAGGRDQGQQQQQQVVIQVDQDGNVRQR